MFGAISYINKCCYKCIVEKLRNYSRTSAQIQYRRRRRNVNEIRDPNPGIQHQLNNLDPDEKYIAETSEFEDMESDFMDVGEMHRMHEQEQVEHKQKVQLKMVGEKYFKSPPGPSMLTWAEKEQIRHLHQSDPDKWDIEKLTESFPASGEIIKKILKSRWQPIDAARLLKHDQAVAKNWELLRKGELEVDPHLEQHLLQFTDRKINVQNVPDPIFEEKWQPRPTKNEFGSIIESYKLLKAKNSKITSKKLEEVVNSKKKPKGETFILKGEESYSPHGRITLDKYREKIQTAIDRGHEASSGTKLMLHQSETNLHDSKNAVTAVEEIDISHSAVLSNDSQTSAKKDIFIGDCPPEKIKVPYKKRNKKTTYKLGDSYYDYDGIFLYRVPGMK